MDAKTELLAREIEKHERALERASRRPGVTQDEIRHLRQKIQYKRDLRDQLIESERELNKYRDKVSRDAQTIKEQKDMLAGWQESARANEAILAGVLRYFGADADNPARIGLDTVREMLSRYRVRVELTEDGKSYSMACVRVEQEENKE